MELLFPEYSISFSEKDISTDLEPHVLLSQ